MKRVSEDPQIYLASSVEKQASEQNARLVSIVATLEDCRAYLANGVDLEAAHLLDITILHLQTRLHQVADSELKALCDAVLVNGSDAPDLPGALTRKSRLKPS